MKRIRHIFDVNIGVNFSKVHFVNSACAFADHPRRCTIVIHLINNNGRLEYHPYNIRHAYINDQLEMSILVNVDLSHSMHFVDS